jgi:outer membrane murein-binding lipoprotein Lpp/ribosome modulation factor
VKLPVSLIVVCTLLLAGCSSTMSKDECRTVDWRTIGYEDGVAGRSGQQIGQHRRACAEYGVTPDLEAYRAGRAEGLREYCRPHNGYRAGVTGAVYYDVCPADLAPAFLTAYDSGHQLYVLERRVSDTDAQIEARRAEIARLQGVVTGNAFEFIGEGATPEQRTQAVLDVKQAAERIGRLNSEIKALEQDRVRYEQELETYRETVAATR